MRNSYRFSYFMVLLLAILMVSLPASAQQPVLKGKYLLAEQGTVLTGPAATLALLTFSENGVVAGRQVTRTTLSVDWFDVTGRYAFDGNNTGSLFLSTTSVDFESNVVTVSSNYRFVLTASKLQAIRTDTGAFTSAFLLPAEDRISGDFAYTDVAASVQNSSVAMISLNSSGTVTGTEIERNAGDVSTARVNGSWVTDAVGFAIVNRDARMVDAEGNGIIVTESNIALAARDRAFFLPINYGDVKLITMLR